MLKDVLKRKYISIAIGIAVIAAASVLIVSLFNENNSVAVISGQRITVDEFNFFLSSTVENYEYAANVTDETRNEYWNSSNVDRKNMAKKQALETARDFKLQLIKAKENNIALDETDSQKIEEDLRMMTDVAAAAARSNETRDIEDSFVKEYGVTMDKCRKIYRDYVLASKFAQFEQGKIYPTDEEIDKHYEEEYVNYEEMLLTEGFTFEEIWEEARMNLIQEQYRERLSEWAGESKYALIINYEVYDSIEVLR